jgi:hypothetical protein
MKIAILDAMLAEKYQRLKRHLNEKALRLCAAADAVCLGRGGITAIARASGLARNTIYAGIDELEEGGGMGGGAERIRRPGAGRKPLTQTDGGLLRSLDRLVDPVTRGDPMSPLRWTCKSTTKLAKELTRRGHRVSQKTVWSLLDQSGYSMQSNRKRLEGARHPDRDAQFRHIARRVRRFMSRRQPVISVDTKKKELVGNFKNGGQEWTPKGQPLDVAMHDFADPKKGKVIPYGVYDIAANHGWVSVGITHDTAQFAAQTIRTWWRRMGRRLYPAAKELLITADGGGSNGCRGRLWKVELQRLANDLRMTIHVCHFPPGTSKWNKIEHRMFCHITENWRARPLISRAAVVKLIANTRTDKGLVIQAALDEKTYDTGIKVEKDALAQLNIEPDLFHGEWNYTVKAQEKRRRIQE